MGHQITSLKATENALGLDVSEQTILLRKLLIHGATIQSNILHAYFLAVPDFLGEGSVFPLITSHKDVVVRALRMKKCANDIGDIISGRAVHPITLVPGGFTRIPTVEELEGLKKRLLEQMIPDALDTVETVIALAESVPNFNRDTEYISLQNDYEYALYDGDIFSSDTGRSPDTKYLSMTNEFIVPHSTSKHAKHHRDSLMVGALARWNNNHSQMHTVAQEAGQKMGLTTPCTNPYMNTIAQVAEVIHCTVDTIDIIDKLISNGLKDERPNQAPTKYGTGIGATEVPRGILYHEYTYNQQGQIEKANCIIPTGQNLGNIDDDMVKLVPEIIHEPKEKIILNLEMLVRAYDPCISCSVHMLEVDFIE